MSSLWLPLALIPVAATLASCALEPDVAPLDRAIVGELQQIADVLSRPQDFPAGRAMPGGRSSSYHPIDFGCALAESFLPDGHWSTSGMLTGTSDFRALDPTSRSREPDDRVARACWRLEQLGCVGLFCDQLLDIHGDPSLGAAMRCQAAHALGSLLDEQVAIALVREIGDEVVGAESLRALVRIGPVRLDGIRGTGLPESEPARSRVIWLLSRHVEALNGRELRWLADALDGASSRQALWTLWRAHERRAQDVVDALLGPMSRDKPPPAALALAAIARILDPRAVRIGLAMVSHPSRTSRQLAYDYLGSIEHPDVFELLLEVAGDDAATPGDRAAAVLALSNYRVGQAQWVSQVGALLESRNLCIQRASLRALASAGELHEDIVTQVQALTRDTDYDIRFLAYEIVHAHR